MKRIVLAAIVALAVVGCGASRPQTEYERYTDICHDRGGFISQHRGWDTFEYSCVGQTTGAALPPMAK